MGKQNLLKIILGAFFLFSGNIYSKECLFIFAGSAVKPVLDEAVNVFSREKGCEMHISYGGSGFVLSQMELSKRGDIFLPASPDFMEKAKKKHVVVENTEKILAYLIPVINVKKGNPKKIKGLNDLSNAGLRLALGNPESVCVGLYAVELLEFNNLLKPVLKNVVTYAESCEKLASLLSLGLVDAIIGWDVFEKWDPERIESVMLNQSDIPRIGYIPVALSAFSKNKKIADEFIDYLSSNEGRNIFRNHGYIVDIGTAKKVAPHAKIGGEYHFKRGKFQ